jgi:alpha-L-fucosidase
MQSKSLIYRLSFYTLVVTTIILAACSSNEKEKQQKKPEKEPLETHVTGERIKEWRKDKLSLFVHFGAYSLFEGEWNNKIIDGPAENIWPIAGIPVEEYERKVRQFNPKKWDANDMVNLARDIGMKRIILNARHHDGFCLFETATTEFNTVDFTPFNRDLVNEMAEACNKGKIKFSVSFSLCNWHLPAAEPMSVNHNTPVTDDHHQVNLTQIEELLTKYGTVSEIYFYSGLNTPEQSREIRELVKQLQPECLISDGIGNDMGDFIATEFNTFPEEIPDVPWNMLASVFSETRGFKDTEPQPDPTPKARQKVREMVRTISSGGNYSLNIGPRKDGSLTGEEGEIIKNIGRWIKVNREAIYDVEKNPFNTVSSSYKITRKANKLYLFIESAPRSSNIRLTGLNNKITSASFLGSGIEPGFSNKGAVNEIIWTAPAMADPMELPVIEVVFEDTIRMLPLKNININPDDTLTLNRNNAIIQQSITQQDRLTAIPSTTSMKWTIKADHKQKADLVFTQAQKGRELLTETAQGQNKIKLEGNQSHLVRSKYDTIQIDDIYESGTFYGDFKDVHINPNGSNRLRILNTSWQNRKTAKDTHLNPLPMSAIYYYVEIESENEQQYSYKITGNDGLQVWINQQEILMARNTTPGAPLVKEVIFDIKKGKNILIIKNYNRAGVKDYFEASPLPEAHWWKQTISIPANPEYIKIGPADPATPHEDIDLQSFSMVLTPE